jgi:site-specific recombinase XerC
VAEENFRPQINAGRRLICSAGAGRPTPRFDRKPGFVQDVGKGNRERLVPVTAAVARLLADRLAIRARFGDLPHDRWGTRSFSSPRTVCSGSSSG